MNRYSEYKEAEVEGVEEIPSNWETIRFDFIFSFARGLPITKKDLKNQGIPCVNYGEIHSKFGFKVDPEIHNLRYVDEDYLLTNDKSLLCRGDIVFADTSEDIVGSGNFTHLDSDVPTFAGYHTIIARNRTANNYRFLAYFLDSTEYRNQIRCNVSGIKVYSITQSILKYSKLLIPPVEEQSQIANYLDFKTVEIDNIIAAKKKLIELYEEEKTAIINQAVTKGINSEVNLKSSGVEYIGDIPQHWNTKKISWCFDIIGSGTTPKSSEAKYYFNGETNWLLTGDLNDGIIYNTSKKITEEAIKDYSTLKKYPSNSIVMAMYGATIGKLGELNIETTVNQACCVLSGPKFHLQRFVFYYLLAIRKDIINLSFGGGQPNISQETVKTLRIPYLRIDEQKLIIEFIEDELLKINTKIEKAKKLIELLTEYRSTLISAVVTGKIKV